MAGTSIELSSRVPPGTILGYELQPWAVMAGSIV